MVCTIEANDLLISPWKYYPEDKNFKVRVRAINDAGLVANWKESCDPEETGCSVAQVSSEIQALLEGRRVRNGALRLNNRERLGVKTRTP